MRFGGFGGIGGSRGGRGASVAFSEVPAQASSQQGIGLSVKASATNTRQYAQASASQVIDVVAAGRLSGSANPGDPLLIVTSVPKALFFSGDLGVTQSSGLVSQWADQSGNGRHATASGTARPTYQSANANFNNRGALLGDGVANIMVVPWNPAAPGTQPLWFFLVMRQVSWTAGDYIFGAGSLQLALFQSGTTPQLKHSNTTSVNTNGNLPVGTAGAVEAYYSNSTSDSLRAGSAAAVTGANAGNTDAATFALFARVTAGFGNVEIASFLVTEGKPTPTEMTNLRAWANTRYAGILV